MSDSVIKAGAFLLVLLGTFLWIGRAITDLTGGEKTISAAVEIGPEGGETVYWGKGRCFTCHSVGDRGSAVRGRRRPRGGLSRRNGCQVRGDPVTGIAVGDAKQSGFFE